MANALFDKIAKAKATAGGQWFNPGKYLLEAKKLIVKEGRKDNMFIGEFVVLEATKTVADREPNAVGTMVSYVVPLGDKDGMGAGNVKTFAMALLNEPESSITGDELEKMCNEENAALPIQPCKYLKIKDEVYEKPQKADPSKMFTHHRWEHVAHTEGDLQAIAARRAAENAAPAAK
jgi:hypothetical protein